jgi:CRP-like cAMP-binding protein
VSKLMDASNRLLKSLTAEQLGCLEQSLTRVELPRGTVLENANEPVESVYFMECGFASVVAGGSPGVEAGIVGREGMTGLSVVMGDDRSPDFTFVQGTGSAFRMPAAALRQALLDSPSLRLTFLRYALAFHVQVTQTAVSNGRGDLEQRLARWLLMAHDRFESDSFELTHEFLALMLCVRRAGVSVALQKLEGQRIIRSERRKITVLDRERLRLQADSSYGVAEAEYERLTRRAPIEDPRARGTIE